MFKMLDPPNVGRVEGVNVECQEGPLINNYGGVELENGPRRLDNNPVTFENILIGSNERPNLREMNIVEGRGRQRLLNRQVGRQASMGREDSRLFHRVYSRTKRNGVSMASDQGSLCPSISSRRSIDVEEVEATWKISNMMGINFQDKKKGEGYGSEKVDYGEEVVFCVHSGIKNGDNEHYAVEKDWGAYLRGVVVTPSIGSAGGMISLQDENVFVVKQQQIHRSYIAIWGGFKEASESSLIRSSVDSKKEDFFMELMSFIGQLDDPFCIWGDFNVYLNQEEKIGVSRNLHSMKVFNDFVMQVLVRRLRGCIDDVIGPSQFAFIQGRQIMDCYFHANKGLQLNLEKSKIVGINMEEIDIKELADEHGCSVGEFPIEYLGLPLGLAQGGTPKSGNLCMASNESKAVLPCNPTDLVVAWMELVCYSQMWTLIPGAIMCANMQFDGLVSDPSLADIHWKDKKLISYSPIWFPPPSGFLKINVDGSVEKEWLRGGIGVIIHDSKVVVNKNVIVKHIQRWFNWKADEHAKSGIG
ncbi:hypothetical protein F3Y22_tig00116970pilonHSYRG00034 [Hibiscus syriacus]|uniref:Reverse transcriptase domain-containing protein n=1 Tax=Hibiscus syriacus TaxID=106335 RepID=A0A6A2WJI7_HIBSY|nr:hypothetical protein F3Y22_tig00116970pilonHSYRG00034 [Hibiscus syriacus]